MSWHLVQDSKAAEVLLAPSEFRLLSVFFGQERSLSQAAKLLKLPPSSLKRKLEQWQHLGLLLQTRLEPRKGKPMRFYRAVSSQIFVPFGFSHAADMGELIWSAQAELFRDFVQDMAAQTPTPLEGGFCIQMHNGRLSVDFSSTPPPDVRLQTEMVAPVWNSWLTLHLEPAAATQLQQDLRALWTRVLEQHGHASPSTKRYTLHLGMVVQSPNGG
jgi:hypothetical protein